jgi:hypothetical protein
MSKLSFKVKSLTRNLHKRNSFWEIYISILGKMLIALLSMFCAFFLIALEMGIIQ